MMRRVRPVDRSLDAPFAVGMVILLLLAAGIGVIVQYNRAYQGQKLQEITVQAEILAASVTAALDFGDNRTAQEAVDALHVNPQILAVGVYDGRGQLFASYERTSRSLPRRPIPHAVDGNQVEVVVPVTQGGRRIGTVYLSSARDLVGRRFARNSLLILLVLLATVSIGVLGFGTVAMRKANRALKERAEALGEAYRRLQVESEERANAEEQLRQAQKMQAIGQLTGGIAHDFNNMLTVIQGSADILRRPGIDEAKRVRFAEAIVQTATRAAALTGQLLAFARRQPLRAEVFDVNAHIVGMTDLLDRTLGERIKVSTDLGPRLCPIETDPAQLEAAILNVAVNARDAMPDGGELTIRTFEARRLEDGRRSAAITISDNGTGIEAETLARVFEPFFTTKAVGKGTGLGLSQVYGFAAQSGGDVDISSTPGKGTSITLILPCSEKVDRKDEPADEIRGMHRTGRILVVDDNEEVGAFAEALLCELGHDVVRKQSAVEALDAAEKDSFDIVFTDVVMPGMSGLDLAELLKLRVPEVGIVLTTGYSDEVTATGTGGLPVVFKPYRLDMIASVLDKVLAQRSG